MGALQRYWDHSLPDPTELRMPDLPTDESLADSSTQPGEHTSAEGFHKTVTDLSRAAWLSLDHLFGDGRSVFDANVEC